MNVLDTFSGIGGFSLSLERAGMKTVAFCEIEEYPRKVLAKHWPHVPIAGDIRKLVYDRKKQGLIYDGKTIYKGSIDVVCGGFPCQDLSSSGKQEGINAERSGLWSSMRRLIGEIQPRFAIVENVTALISGDSGRWLGRLLGDLAEIGYDAEWHCIPASELGAHHHRDRVWIVAYPNEDRLKAIDNKKSNDGKNKQGLRINSPTGGSKENVNATELSFSLRKYNAWKVEPGMARMVDGVSNWTYRIEGLGNAVVPQIPELIGKAIMEAL